MGSTDVQGRMCVACVRRAWPHATTNRHIDAIWNVAGAQHKMTSLEAEGRNRLLPVLMGLEEVLDDVVLQVDSSVDGGPGIPFDISSQKLDYINAIKDVQLLEKEGGIHTVAKKLRTHLEGGIDTDSQPQTILERQQAYGHNEVRHAKAKGFLRIVGEQLADPTVRLLMAAAVLSLVLGLAIAEERRNKNYVDGIAIWIAVFAVSFIGAFNDYQKEKQFRKLNATKENTSVKVVRSGRKDLIPSTGVVCGDVLVLEMGDKIVADGLLIASDHLCVDEAALTGESEPVQKSKSDPFCRAGTQVTEGSGTMLVTGVGNKSEWGKTMGLIESDGEDTPLQEKLRHLASNIGKVGIAVALICFVTLTTHWLIENGGFKPERFNDVVRFFLFSVTIVVVAVPEGLPLAVTISLAYSMKKMMKDNNFVRALAACETMGGATVICSDKTGTITENRMSVVSAWMAGHSYELMARPASFPSCVLEHLAKGISLCTTAFLLFDGMDIQLVGSRTECALLLLLEKLRINYEEVRAASRVVEHLNFSSERKFGGARVSGQKADIIYCIGAAEIVLCKCSASLSSSNEILPLEDARRAEIEARITDMSKQGLRTLCLAFKEVPVNRCIQLEQQLSHMCIFGIVGIKDPIRPEVPRAVQDCKRAGIQVKMVTGDNVYTACHIAKDCGILQADGKIVEGPTFRSMGDEEVLRILPNLSVLARSSPADKHRLVKLLKAQGEVVAVTGDGTNDAPALKESDVGLAMGKCGTDVAKEASDIIILDDNFASIVKAVLWGRSVFNNIRKFLQFQLTINAVALILAFVGAVTKKGMPLTVLQLLWVNLIMDSLAALALATEPPDNSLLRKKPNDRKKPLISRRMWKHILVQGTFQFTILLMILYALPLLNNYNFPDDCRVDYERWLTDVDVSFCRLNVPNPQEICAGASSCQTFKNLMNSFHAQEALYNESFEFREKEVNSLIFNTFIFCQIFNAFNARKVSDELNVFKGIFSDKTFLYIIIVILGVQIFIMQFLGDFFHLVDLTALEWLFCAAAGLVSLPLAALTKISTKCVQNLYFNPSQKVHAKEIAWIP